MVQNVVIKYNKLTSLLLRLVIPKSLATSSFLATNGGSLDAAVMMIQTLMECGYAPLRKVLKVIEHMHM